VRDVVAALVSGPVHVPIALTPINHCHNQSNSFTRRHTMTTSTLGLLAGLLVAIAAAAGGFPGFLLAVVLGAAGWAVGAYRSGELDLAGLRTGRRHD
jgi:hypothetical protein